MDDRTPKDSLSRRSFLREASGLTLLGMLAAEEIRAQAEKPAEEAAAGPPVALGVIGLGQQGRDLVTQITKVPGASVAALCDSYEASLNRLKEAAPQAATYDDYKKLLEDKNVQGVVIATPTHLHKQIALDAVAAGKHVYLEAPIAHTLEDAKAIAQAGKGSQQVFQVGQQIRSTPLGSHVLKFMRSGVLGTAAGGKMQWHKKTSWRRAAPTPEREAALNWRLSKSSAAGLMGEIGVHQVDLANWWLRALPVAVTGYGATVAWTDGREIPDTVFAIIEYPGNVRVSYDITLANSIGGASETFMGTESAVFRKEPQAWLIKEADSALLGWEVYARKDKLMDDTGIGLVADATKQLQEGKEPGHSEADQTPALFYAMEEFVKNIREKQQPICGALEGYQAAVATIKANEAILSGNRVTFEKADFELS